MKKLLLIALFAAPQMQAMQMGDLTPKTHKKNSSSSCCSVAKVLCLSALISSGQAQATAGNTGAGRASETALDEAGVAGLAGACSTLGTAVAVVGLTNNGATIVDITSPTFISQCLNDVYSEHWAGNAGDAGNLAPHWFDMTTVGLANGGAFVFTEVNVQMLAHDLAREAIEGSKDCQGDEPGKACLRDKQTKQKKN